MNSKVIKIEVMQFDNGDICLGYFDGLYTIKNSDGIFQYSKNEMEEVYGKVTRKISL